MDPHSIASINPHISYTEPASRLFVHSNWEALQFFLLYFKTKSNSDSEKKKAESRLDNNSIVALFTKDSLHWMYHRQAHTG